MASSLKIVNNQDFRELKGIAKESAFQTEYNGSNIDSTVYCKALVAVKGKDGGVLLICLTDRAIDIGGFDKLPFEYNSEGLVNNPQVITIHLHASKYQVYDFKAGGKIDVEPWSCEKILIEYLTKENLLNKVFKGKFDLQSSFNELLDAKLLAFVNGTWTDEPIPPQIAKVITEYETGSASGGKGGFKDYKTYAQKVTERVDVLANILHEVNTKPGTPFPTDVSKTAYVFSTLSALEPVAINALEAMLPKS